MYKIFPELETEVTNRGNATIIELRTTLRVLGDDGKWYLTLFKDTYSIDSSMDMQKELLLLYKRVTFNIYIAITLIKVDVKAINLRGIPVFIEDQNQEDEKTRMMKAIHKFM